jgi:hypothetical protein
MGMNVPRFVGTERVAWHRVRQRGSLLGHFQEFRKGITLPPKDAAFSLRGLLTDA